MRFGNQKAIDTAKPEELQLEKEIKIKKYNEDGDFIYLDVIDIDFLKECFALEKLEIRGAKITTLLIQNAIRLQHIFIFDCKDLQNIDQLEYCVNLTYIFMQHTSVQDLSPIVNLKNLETLKLVSNDQLPLEFQVSTDENKREVKKLLNEYKQTQQYKNYPKRKGTQLIPAQKQVPPKQQVITPQSQKQSQIEDQIKELREQLQKQEQQRQKDHSDQAAQFQQINQQNQKIQEQIQQINQNIQNQMLQFAKQINSNTNQQMQQLVQQISKQITDQINQQSKLIQQVQNNQNQNNDAMNKAIKQNKIQLDNNNLKVQKQFINLMNQLQNDE